MDMHLPDPGPDQYASNQSCMVLCDWGGSRLRAYLQTGGEVIARRDGPGIGGLKDPPIATLQDVLMPWRTSAGFDRIVMCGMVGSRNGLMEVPYVRAPVAFDEWAAQRFEGRVDELPLLIAAGIQGLNASEVPDVMRGEETQIFGAMEIWPALARGRYTLLLPGTHSKWVQVIGGRINSFQTYITGELHALLSDHSSLLRTGDASENEEGGFAAGLARARTVGLSGSLFEARASQLTLGRSRAWARAFLSGLLIGDEVAKAVATSSPQSVILIGEGRLADLYRESLYAQSIPIDVLDADRCVIAGLRLLAGRTRRLI